MSDDNNSPKHHKQEDDGMFGVERDNRGRFKPGTSGNPQGKPKGTRTIASKQSIKKLAELDNDPIEQLVGIYEAILNGKMKGSAGDLIRIQERLLEMGYSKQPTLAEIKTETIEPFQINTSTKDDSNE